jgi:hypothetical protein
MFTFYPVLDFRMVTFHPAQPCQPLHAHSRPTPSPPADAAFRNLTRPAVLKDAGVIIEPIRYSKAAAEHAQQAPTRSKRAAVSTVAGGMARRAKKSA